METKSLSEISRKDWILYEWIQYDEFGSNRTYYAGEERTPDEAMQAAEAWDFLQSVKDGET